MIAYAYGDALYLNITNRCTNDCDFCIRRYADGIAGHNLWLAEEPSVDEIMNAVGDPSKYGEIVFCGYGEPLERLDVVLAVCRRLKEMEAPPIRIDTNGQANLIYGRNIAPELAGLVDAVSISLNASSPEEYVAHCHPAFGAGAYAAMLSFTRECLKVLPSVTMTVLDLPETDIEACRGIAARMGAGFRVRHFSRDI